MKYKTPANLVSRKTTSTSDKNGSPDLALATLVFHEARIEKVSNSEDDLSHATGKTPDPPSDDDALPIGPFSPDPEE
jgi:hypothetical protein